MSTKTGRASESRRSQAKRMDSALSSLAESVAKLPVDLKGWRKLIDQAGEQVRMAAGRKRIVAIVGPANAGKSTLYNQMIRAKNNRAEVSALPGTTRHSQQGDAGIFMIADTPGADMAGTLGEAEKERALQTAAEADVLIILFDASHGVRQPEEELFSQLMALSKPAVVGLNKIDLVWKERVAVRKRAAEALDLATERIVPLSAKRGNGIGELLQEVVHKEPGIAAALGIALPAYRWKLAQAVIARSASTAGAIALTPLPFVDFVPLAAVQVSMVLGIARIFAYRITIARARELIAALGLGALGRMLFYELSKFGGPPGWLLSAGVAAGTTAGMGYAAAAWFERGEKLSRDAVKRIARIISKDLVERLRHIGRKRPKRESLRERMYDVLEEIDLEQVARQGEAQD